MKKRPILCTALVLAALVAFLAVRYLPGVVRESQCGEVYHRYAHVSGVEASYVKDYPISDTLAVDVTILRAPDSAGWQYLIEAFHIAPEVLEMPPFLFVCQSLKGHPEERYAFSVPDNLDTLPIENVTVDTRHCEICIFHSRNRQQFNAIFSNRLFQNVNPK